MKKTLAVTTIAVALIATSSIAQNTNWTDLDFNQTTGTAEPVALETSVSDAPTFDIPVLQPPPKAPILMIPAPAGLVPPSPVDTESI